MKKLIFIDTCIRAGYAIHQGQIHLRGGLTM